ncbi:alcohol dehydrogenase catalytic domain-containing protein [Rhodococcoides corynebacterioides]|uniref:alcohol dehydrogenase catalytic domain-containing protein n=1 Tax=Rhodococcoides corynebacterioides TaxID=53972 RepID=UPI003AEA991A
MDRSLMLAVQLLDWGGGPVVRDVPVPSPTGGEVLLEVTAAGLCRSDLAVCAAPAGRFDYPLPLTLGHEVAGRVVRTGPDVDGDLIGRSVVVHGVWSCRRCRNCRRGRENYCLALRPVDGRLAPIGGGLGRDGGLAEYMVVPDPTVLVDIGSLPPASAAPLADAGATAYHVVESNADLLDENAVVIVVGIGGLGHLAVRLAVLRGAGHVVAVDPRAAARMSATTMGASSVHESLSDAIAETDGLGGTDLVLDFVGADDTMSAGVRALVPGGRLVVVGGAGGAVSVGKNKGLSAGWQVSAPFWGTRADLEAVVALATAGLVEAEVSTRPLDEAVDAYDRLRAGVEAGRTVLLPPRSVADHAGKEPNR